jgi:hypothetical protein
VRWSFAAGPGEGKPCVSRFGPEFLALVLEPIRRISGIDVTEIFDRNVTAETAVDPLDRLHRLLRGLFGSEPFTATDILGKLGLVPSDADASVEFDGGSAQAQEFKALIQEGRGGKLSAQLAADVGRVLMGMEHRTIDGFRFQRRFNKDVKANYYWFRPPPPPQG